MPTLIYYALFLFVYAGFVLHHSTTPGIGPYSAKYLALLVLLAAGFAIPPVIKVVARRIGAKQVLFALTPSAGLLVLGYLAAAQYYYHSAEHRFDPFLQAVPVAPASFSAKGPGVFRILTLGGSTTAEYDLASADRYPTLLRDMVQRDHPELTVEVFNAGMDWFTTKHSLINYTTSLAEWKPDLVIVMHGINDLYRSFEDPEFSLGPYNRLWSHYYGAAIEGARAPTFERYWWSYANDLWYYDLRYQQRDLPMDRYRSLPDYRRNLGLLVHFLKADGLKVVLMTEPFLYKDAMPPEERAALWFGKTFCKTRTGIFTYEYPSPSSLRAAMDAFNGATRDLGTAENVQVIDLAPRIPRTLEYFVDDVHYRAKGARMVATVVAEELGRAGALAGAR